MKPQYEARFFEDSPSPKQLARVLANWHIPDLPEQLKGQLPKHFRRRYYDFRIFYRERLESTKSLQSLRKDERTLIDWLYSFIRLNIKRGRIFDLREVLQYGEADCLGYVKLMTTLGRECGLDLGLVEVIIDNRGCNVPHTATLVKLSGGKRQFVDFWYGSSNIRHKRLCLQVKTKGTWNIGDIDFPEIKKAEDISYLPDDRVDGITLYVEGNRSLKEGNYAMAIEQFTEAIHHYPENARIYYNRAIGYEKLGQPQKAQPDYARALQDDASLKRTIATQDMDIVDLIRLDEKFIPELIQQIYLLRSGFITGRPVTPGEIARKLDLPQEEVESILSCI